MAQALLPVLILLHLARVHRQECLCHGSFSASSEACATYGGWVGGGGSRAAADGFVRMIQLSTGGSWASRTPGLFVPVG